MAFLVGQELDGVIEVVFLDEHGAPFKTVSEAQWFAKALKRREPELTFKTFELKEVQL